MHTIHLSQRQREIIVGTVLGDSHLESQNGGRTYRLKFMHASSQKPYIDWLYEEFKNIAAHEPQEKTILLKNKKYTAYWFNTVSLGSLRFYAKQFYINGKKVVPQYIKRLLTPLGCAVWYMDDGSIKSHQTRGRIFNTQGFQKAELNVLINALWQNFSIRSIVRKQREGWQLFIPAEMYQNLIATIGTLIIPSMRYKLFFPSKPFKELDNTMPKE